jgi:hypothetical protein
MKRLTPKEDLIDVICPACHGTGFPSVRQAVQPGRKIYSPPCKRCFGKGRISEVQHVMAQDFPPLCSRSNPVANFSLRPASDALAKGELDRLRKAYPSLFLE